MRAIARLVVLLVRVGIASLALVGCRVARCCAYFGKTRQGESNIERARAERGACERERARERERERAREREQAM